MRQCRGMTKDGKWVFGWFLENPHGQCFIVSTADDAPPVHTTAVNSLYGTHDIVIVGAVEVIPSTVGQALDLDLKSLEDFDEQFWEGDIVECRHGHKGPIVYDNHYEGGGKFYVDFPDGDECEICWEKERWYYYKRIGTIHDKE